jgi:branched-chain amino acid transport system substrate-binding protein
MRGRFIPHVASFRRAARVAALLLSLVVAACGSSSNKPAAGGASGGTAAATGSPIRLGVMADVTGPFSIEAAEIHISVDLAVSQINSSGGINGHRVEVVYTDPKADPAEAVRSAQQLVQQDHVDVLLGAISSAECLGIQQLAPKLGVVYMPMNGCANDQFAAQSCNKYSFRVQPVGKQLIDPVMGYALKSFGKRWAIVYPDYAFGQSQLAAYQASLDRLGGQLTVKIPIPLGEANVTPYITKIPLDGSIDGVINSENGTDLSRVTTVMQQFSVTSKLPVIGTTGKEFFGGVYPDAINNSLGALIHLAQAQPDNKFDQAFDQAWQDQAAKEPSLVSVLGGPGKAVAGGNGYQVYIAVTALKEAMISAKFTGKADTEKLISAMENLNAPQGPDFPAGPVIMNKSDHQGRATLYIFKINGQNEQVVETVPPAQLPMLGTCQV